MPTVLMILKTVVFMFNEIHAAQEPLPTHEIMLMILKIIMFTLLIIGPVVIGRELTQAARGQAAAQPGATTPAEDKS